MTQTLPELSVGPKPSNIDISDMFPFCATFGASEPEDAARYLIQFAQHQETEHSKIWEDFTLREINGFFNIKRGSFKFAHLIGNYIKKKGKAYSFTPEFVKKCHDASPKN